MRTPSRSIYNLFTLIALLTALTGGTVTYTPARAAGILFAKPTPTGNGNCSSWANGCTLQIAIAFSLGGDEIWVQAGRYIPHSTDRGLSFNLKNGVAIYGGFAGTETQRNQRNPAANVTILSGDLNGDDSRFLNNDENSYHVVRSRNVSSSSILDGFTIRGGNANDSADKSGGGMLNSGGSPTLTNLIFSENSASGFGITAILGSGGGMHNDSSSPTLTNVTFSLNRAYIGGGMSGFANSSPRLTNVTFSGNSASFHGGGMGNANNSPTLTNVTFSGNSAGLGGGMFNNNSSPMLINTIIANSQSGGDCAGSTVNALSSYNLIEDLSLSCGLVNSVNGNIIGADPKLGTLANNGGPTQTHALLAGSPAINTGRDANCPAADQRGVTRPQGIHCDIGSFESRTFTIGGNAGAAGLRLNYNVDSTTQAAITQSNGIYSLPIPEGWSGTVTPSHACFTFNPPSRNYGNLTTNQTVQNYSALLNPSSGCAAVNVKFGQTTQGTAGIPASSGVRLSFPADSGPVLVNGTNSVLFIASERVVFPKIGGTPTHFSEMMGLPDHLKSTKYSFPAYDNIFFDSQLRFANVGNANTTVTVTVGNLLSANYLLAPNESRRVSFAGQSGGPILIQSSGGVPIIASLRVVPKPSTGSFSEIMGLPQSQWSTSYIFPWYNSTSLDTQLRVGNVGASATTVTVTIGGVSVGSFALGSNQSKRISFANLDRGPVRVTSSGGVLIVASLRVAFKSGNTWTGFSEIMGLPESQLAAGYVFPWYNNLDLNTQLRFANVSSTNTSVRVFIGGQEVAGSPFALPPGQSLRRSFAVDKGPVVIRSTNGAKIIASLRVLFQSGNTATAFSELIGLPENQLSTSYLFPYYNNLALNTQLRLGVP